MSERMQVHKHGAVKRARRKPQQRNGPTVTTRVHRDVMRMALKLAGGDASRVRVRNGAEVIVMNQGRRAA